MDALKQVSLGWKKLTNDLNGVIDRTNQMRIIPSASVGVSETPGGVVLSVLQPDKDKSQPGGGGGGGGSGAPTAIVLNNMAWQTVQVVDPGTCIESYITVLIQQPGASIQLSVTATGGSWTLDY
jgi:uncharacterized spore protein YtfJ